MGRARKARLEPPGGGGARAHACEWGRAVASAEGTKSPKGASCPSCYEFGFVSARSSQSLHANNVGQSEYKNYQETIEVSKNETRSVNYKVTINQLCFFHGVARGAFGD